MFLKFQGGFIGLILWIEWISFFQVQELDSEENVFSDTSKR